MGVTREIPRYGVSLALVAVASMACGSSDPAAADAEVPTNDAGLSQVTGTFTVDYHSETGVEQVPLDLTASTVVAWLPRDDGTYARIDGIGFDDGTFAIDDVPEHLVYIQIDEHFIGTASRTVDFGTDRVGRPDRVGAGSGTRVVFDVDGLRPWSSSDWLMLFMGNSWNVDRLEIFATPDIAEGADTLGGVEFSWGHYLLDANEGDRASLIQLENRTSGDIPYWTPIRVFEAPPVSMVDQTTTTFSGSFADVPQDRELDIEWNAAAYSFQERDVNSEAVGLYGRLGLHARPPGGSLLSDLERGKLIQFPWVWGFEAVDASALSYGDIYPAEWPRYISAQFVFWVEYVVGNTEPSTASAFMHYAVEDDDLLDGEVTVRMSPVTNLLCNGFPARVAQTGVTTTPALSWNEPAIGATPSGYKIDVLPVSALDGNTVIGAPVATLYTLARSLSLPPGLVSDGQPFVVRIAAIWSPNGDFATSPRRESLPYVVSEALTGLLTP
jgi:hypothetical protein